MAKLRVGAATDTGQLRPANEDNLLVTERLFVVADGMGGHEAGEVASQIAVERIAQLLDGDDLPSADQVVSAIRTANGDIFRAAIANPGQAGMGTTVTAIAVIADPYAGRAEPNIGDDPETTDGEGPHPEPDDVDAGDTTTDLPGDVTPVVPMVPSEALVLANVGDSRTYLFRHGRLRRVTVDHSYVQELLSTGHITESEARNHPRRNIITRALGIEADVRVDWWTLPLIRGDRFVLCSDGLVDEVDDADITATLLEHPEPQGAADQLVQLANRAGGRDNITVVVLDVLDGDDPPDPTEEIDVVPLWPDGTSDPTPAGTFQLDADPSVGDATPSREPEGEEPPTPRRRRSVKRALVGLVAVAAVIVGVVLVSVWARGGYYVAFDDSDEAIIYRGRSGGFLWIDPTAQSAAGPTRDDLEPEVAAQIDESPRFDSVAAAAEFIVDGVTTTTTTTTTSTTTTTTTTTVPPTSSIAPGVGGPTGVTTTIAGP